MSEEEVVGELADMIDEGETNNLEEDLNEVLDKKPGVATTILLQEEEQIWLDSCYRYVAEASR